MTKDLAAKDFKNDQIEVFFPHNPDSSRLLIGCRTADFSASRIAHAVEDADARLLNLNVTSLQSPGADLVVALRISHRDAHRAATSLERYGFSVINIEDTPDSDDTIRRRYEELMRILEI